MSRAVLVLVLVGCGGSVAAPAPTGAPQAPDGSESSQAEQTADAERGTQLDSGDDAVHGWAADSTHEQTSRALTLTLVLGHRFLTDHGVDPSPYRSAAVATLQHAITVAAPSGGDAPHPMLLSFRRDVLGLSEDEGSPVMAPEVPATDDANTWVVASALADGLVRQLVPIVLRAAGRNPDADRLGRLGPLGSPLDDEASFVAAGNALVPIVAASGDAPSREHAEPEVRSVIWFALEALALAAFASEGTADDDTFMQPDTDGGWCMYARLLSYELWTHLSEAVYWVGMDIADLETAQEEPMEEERDGPGQLGSDMSTHELQRMSNLQRRFEPLTLKVRTLSVTGSPEQLRAAVAAVTNDLHGLAPMLPSVDLPFSRQVGRRRAEAVAILCAGR